MTSGIILIFAVPMIAAAALISPSALYNLTHGLLFYAIVWLGQSAARMRDLEDENAAVYEAIPLAIQGSLIVFAVGSTFYSCQRMDLPYIFLMAAAAWRTIEPSVWGQGFCPAQSSRPRFSSAPGSIGAAEFPPPA